MKYSVKYVGSGLLLASFVVAQGNDLPECGVSVVFPYLHLIALDFCG